MSGVKYNVAFVSVIRPGADVCCAGNARGDRSINLEIDGTTENALCVSTDSCDSDAAVFVF
jgi:hypothetical protein